MVLMGCELSVLSIVVYTGAGAGAVTVAVKTVVIVVRSCLSTPPETNIHWSSEDLALAAAIASIALRSGAMSAWRFSCSTVEVAARRSKRTFFTAAAIDVIVAGVAFDAVMIGDVVDVVVLRLTTVECEIAVVEVITEGVET